MKAKFIVDEIHEGSREFVEMFANRELVDHPLLFRFVTADDFFEGFQMFGRSIFGIQLKNSCVGRVEEFCKEGVGSPKNMRGSAILESFKLRMIYSHIGDNIAGKSERIDKTNSPQNCMTNLLGMPSNNKY